MFLCTYTHTHNLQQIAVMFWALFTCLNSVGHRKHHFLTYLFFALCVCWSRLFSSDRLCISSTFLAHCSMQFFLSFVLHMHSCKKLIRNQKLCIHARGEIYFILNFQVPQLPHILIIQYMNYESISLENTDRVTGLLLQFEKLNVSKKCNNNQIQSKISNNSIVTQQSNWYLFKCRQIVKYNQSYFVLFIFILKWLNYFTVMKNWNTPGI